MASLTKKILTRWDFWCAVVGLAIALGLWIFSFCYTIPTSRKMAEYTPTNATVIDNKLIDGSYYHGHVTPSTLAPIVEYKVNGVRYVAQDKMSSTIGKKIGSEIKVVYNPENPEDVLFINSERGLFAFLFCFAIALSAFGIYIAVYLANDVKRIKIMLTYQNAKFITSAANKTQFIKSDKPIIAVSGKSNVGKSSFINMLAGQSKLAKVSKAPGRTRLVNYFDFGDFILADLPGYGYAQVSKQEKMRWANLMEEFFADKANIKHVFALVDLRHLPTEDDKQMINYLYANIIPFTVIATKSDKLSRMAITENKKKIAASLKCGADDIIPTSSLKRSGIVEVINKIKAIISVEGE